MKILILTQYFPPETGAPQNRLHSLSGYFSELGAEVSILTAMPNYPKMEVYEDYKGKFYHFEVLGNIKIHRAWIFVSKSKSVIFRLLNYFSFVFSSILVGILKVSKHDIIICESPPLFLGISALIIKWFKNSKLVFNVSDLWPESAEKLDIVTNKMLLGLSYKLEGLLYTKSNLVSGQTQGIVKNISKRFPLVKTYWLPNGIDFNQYNVLAEGTDFRLTLGLNTSDFILMYAGIFGYAQGIDVIIRSAFLTKNLPEIKYVIIGDGPEKEKLKDLANEFNLKNVLFVDNIPRENMPNAIAACNAYIVPLKKNDLFLGAIPSKLFEPLAMGKPILLGVDGEARELFIEKGKGGLFFTPEDAGELAEKVIYLNANRNEITILGENGKNFVSLNFNRKNIAIKFFEELILLVRNK
jgi:glycosyltransferase involved in cell wall biosynthesis